MKSVSSRSKFKPNGAINHLSSKPSTQTYHTTFSTGKTTATGFIYEHFCDEDKIGLAKDDRCARVWRAPDHQKRLTFVSEVDSYQSDTVNGRGLFCRI